MKLKIRKTVKDRVKIPFWKSVKNRRLVELEIDYYDDVPWMICESFLETEGSSKSG